MVELTLEQFVKDLKKFWPTIQKILLKEKGEHCKFVIPAGEALNNPAFSDKYSKQAIGKFTDYELDTSLFLEQVRIFLLESFENAPENVEKAIDQLVEQMGQLSEMYSTLGPKVYARDYIDRFIEGEKERKSSFFKAVRYSNGFKIRDMTDAEIRKVLIGKPFRSKS